MQQVKGETIDDVFIELCKQLHTHGRIITTETSITKELLNVTAVITDPTKVEVTIPERRLSKKYLNAELKWYLSGNLNPDPIAKLGKIWDRIRNPDGTVNSNYGYIAFHQPMAGFFGMNQFDWCVKSFIDNLATRQAVINFNQPKHKTNEVKDFVCTMYSQFLVRNNALEMYTYMRSNDLVYGFCYDVPFFTYLQVKMREILKKYYQNIELGNYHHTATSMHVYDRHFKMIEQVTQNH